MLQISPISNSPASFKQNNNKPVMYRTYKTEATTGKKWGVGIISWLLPGAGQAINNEWGKGAGFFALSVFGPMIIGALTGVGMMATIKRSTKALTTAAIAGITAMWGVAIGARIWACVDAVKNATSEIQIPVKH